MRPGREKIVVLGSMTKMPVAGVVWQTLHYLVGFKRLGFDVYYVEAHARTPSMFVRSRDDDGSERAAAFVGRIMDRFDLGDRWAFHALHSDGRCYGLSASELEGLYGSAALLVNLHGGTVPLPEHTATGRLLFLGTDPVQVEVEVYHGNAATIEFLRAHSWHFSYAENYGRDDCRLPVSAEFDFRPTRQPVILDWWSGFGGPDNGLFTTIGNWRQRWRDIGYRGETYRWSKDDEFSKVLDLPSRSTERFELALSSIDEADRRMLEAQGWSVRNALDLSDDIDEYRSYIARSRGEFTVAKDQNVRFRSGWFSDRSATYLAAGRPVITQDTGFGSVLPTGSGLFAFATVDEAAEAVAWIRRDYPSHRRGALQVAREFFGHGVVLGALLEHVGVHVRRRGRRTETGRTGSDPRNAAPERERALHRDLVIRPVRRHPTELHPETLRRVEPMGAAAHPAPGGISRRGPFDPVAWERPGVSIVIVTFNKLSFTKLCIESLLANTETPHELIVVDNGSSDGTPAYLRQLEQRFPHVHPLLQGENTGFAAANNRGLARACGDLLVLLNNDTIVPPGWLERLGRHLANPDVGAVGAVTNRICNEAQVEADYDTYDEFLRLARGREETCRELAFEIPSLTMFCFAMRRDVLDRVGPLDEGYGTGTVEDDDYSLRIRALGLRLLCAEDVFVHHFGQASFGDLVPTGEYAELLADNQRRFEEKWGIGHIRYGRRASQGYTDLKNRIREIVRHHVPETATVLVVSKGDDDLLQLDGRRGWHLPQGDGGGYAGWYPSDSEAAIEQVETLRARGAGYLVVPGPSHWWLEFYAGLRRHLESRYATLVQEPDACTIFALTERGGSV